MSTNDYVTMRDLMAMVEKGAMDETALLMVETNEGTVVPGKMGVRVDADGALVVDARVEGG